VSFCYKEMILMMSQNHSPSHKNAEKIQTGIADFNEGLAVSQLLALQPHPFHVLEQRQGAFFWLVLYKPS